MALEFKQALRQIQTPTLTLQMQQAIKLLQLSQMELADVVNQELVENPTLEVVEQEPANDRNRDNDSEAFSDAEPEPRELADPPRADEVPSTNDVVDDIDWSAYLADRSERTRSYGSMEARSDDLPSYDQVLTRSDTLTEHLTWQLAMADLTPKQRYAAELIIGNIDDDGMLATPLDELADGHVDVELLESMLPLVHQLDPVGIAARNLRECLLVQVDALYPDNQDLRLLIDQHLDLLMKRDPAPFARVASISLDRAQRAMRAVRLLDPRPGRAFNDERPRYITPDVHVVKVGDDYEVQLNDDGLPKLKVSNYYRDVLGGMAGKDRDYVKERLSSAKWLIKSIYERRRTIDKVMRSIVKQQRSFFEEGVHKLLPMVLRDVADDIGMHESTVSRVTSNKYVHCAQGTFSLKFFFNSGVSTHGGDDMASEAVKSRLKKHLEGEDQRRPLSDQTLVGLLQEEGIEVARRTVAKYRTQMGYLPSSKRRCLY